MKLSSVGIIGIRMSKNEVQIRRVIQANNIFTRKMVNGGSNYPIKKKTNEQYDSEYFGYIEEILLEVTLGGV